MAVCSLGPVMSNVCHAFWPPAPPQATGTSDLHCCWVSGRTVVPCTFHIAQSLRVINTLWWVLEPGLKVITLGTDTVVPCTSHITRVINTLWWVLEPGLKVTTLGTDTAPIENSGQALLWARFAACNVPPFKMYNTPVDRWSKRYTFN